MDNTVIAVYDDPVQAQHAMNELLTSGFARNTVSLNPDVTPGMPGQAIDGDQMSYEGALSWLRTDDQRGDHDMYSEAVRRGSYVLTVEIDSDEELERATEIMSRFEAVDIEDRSTHWRKEGWSGFDAKAPRYTSDQAAQERSRYSASHTPGTSLESMRQDEVRGTTHDTGDAQRIPVIEEEMKVGKREVQRGGVRVLKRIRETPVHESVNLREEHVKVERRPVDQPASEADLAAFKEQSIEVRATSEEAVVEKNARVVEEVVLGKEVSHQTADVHDTVRKTDVEVEQLVVSTSGGYAASDDTDFRRHWKSAYGDSGGRYEDYDDAYRYGSTMAGSGRYKDYRWDDVEPDLRSDWESNHPGSAWDKVKDAVRYGAERVTGRRGH